MAVNLRQTHFRFGTDELAESTHGWKAAEDTNVYLAVNATFLLRFTEQETGGTAAGNTDAQFQYNKNGAGWVNITTSSAVVKAVAAAAFANGANCTKRLSGTGTFESSAAGCTEDGTSGGTTNDIAASGNSETECGLQIVGTDVVRGDVIQFRFTSPDWTVGYNITPQATVMGNASLPCVAGSLPLVGAATSLLYNHLVGAAVGFLPLTGIGVTLSKGITLAVNTGAFSLVGENTSLLHARIASASIGLLPLSGSDVSVLFDHVINGASGTFDFAGLETGLQVNRRIGVSAGNFPMAGGDSGLFTWLLLNTMVGNFQFLGSSALLTYVGGGSGGGEEETIVHVHRHTSTGWWRP